MNVVNMLYVLFGLYVPDCNLDDASHYMYLVTLNDDVGVAYEFFQSRNEFLKQFPTPRDFFVMLESHPAIMLENAADYYNERTGEKAPELACAGWPWPAQSEAKQVA